MSIELKVIVTGDGSHSLLNTALNETYHSVHGAMQESEHVFINNGLDYVRGKRPDRNIRILEIGFGTGLNAWLTARYAATHKIFTDLASVEAFPVPKEVIDELNYPTETGVLNIALWNDIHASAWNIRQEVGEFFVLTKHETTIQEMDFADAAFDLIYFDAFGPAKQPELWDFAILEKVTSRLSPDGVFVTYCARGQLKRDLRGLGLKVETLQGAPGKKEMVRATRPAII